MNIFYVVLYLMIVSGLQTVLLGILAWLLWKRTEPPAKGPHWIHEPVLFDEDSNPIRGLKRCKHCGLSEIYWNRWPKCKRAGQP